MGDDPEFRGFFDRHYRSLRDLGFLLSGNWAEAEELAQDALVRTYSAWPRIRDPERAGPYARRALVNRHRSLLRRALTQARYAHRLPRPDPAASQAPEAEDRLLLWSALRRLPARQRTVLVLRYYEDLSEAEIARLIGWPLGTVKSLTRRGLARLRASPGVAAAWGEQARTAHRQPEEQRA